MRLITVIGPYTGKGSTSTKRSLSLWENISNGRRACLALLLAGYAVHCPWLDIGYDGHLKCDDPTAIKILQANTAEMIRRSDAVLALPGWEGSKGAKKDLKLAQKTGRRVFYERETMLRLFPPQGGKP